MMKYAAFLLFLWNVNAIAGSSSIDLTGNYQLSPSIYHAKWQYFVRWRFVQASASQNLSP
ncbi:hypothetical protein [Alysiella crassa]|uniref:Uncharacterized protein n=1 Tax=Alysiella crassa TaxID=153491 RepID=A0A376BTD2_9NEIS|nr:hypothetical protein [Alysiella crassa]UOP08088.1 hypothetical protein LVJ80_07235 [Alysiella crassa]SSY80169.1 Uncharacterised protein [Alysiella crassa]